MAGTTSLDRQKRAEQEASSRGLTIVPPFDHKQIIIGQGTMGLEILEQCPDVATVFVPVGGGGMASGVAAAIKLSKPSVRIIAVEPIGAPKMSKSIEAGHPITLPSSKSIADGLMNLRPGDLTFAHIRAYVDEVVIVSEEAIAGAVGWLFRNSRLVVEPSGAVTTAAVALGLGNVDIRKGPVVAVVSGGNVAPEAFAKYSRGRSVTPTKETRVVRFASAFMFAVFVATVEPAAGQAAPYKIVVLAGEDSVNVIQQKTAVAPLVEVRDRNNQPVSGAVVTFAVQGGKAAAFQGGATTMTIATNAAGQAAATGLTPLTAGAVNISVEAAVQGQVVTAAITQVNVMTAAEVAAAAGRNGRRIRRRWRWCGRRRRRRWNRRGSLRDDDRHHRWCCRGRCRRGDAGHRRRSGGHVLQRHILDECDPQLWLLHSPGDLHRRLDLRAGVHERLDQRSRGDQGCDGCGHGHDVQRPDRWTDR